jgi:hypothetical protein
MKRGGGIFFILTWHKKNCEYKLVYPQTYIHSGGPLATNIIAERVISTFKFGENIYQNNRGIRVAGILTISLAFVIYYGSFR